VTTPFTALTGAPRKAEEIKKLVPPWVETRFSSLIGALLHVMGLSDHQVTVGDRTLFVRGANPAGNVLYVAKQDDDSIRVQHLRPTANPSSLTVAVSGKDILVTLATDLLGDITTTPAQLKAAIAAVTAASDLVSVITFGLANEAVGSFRQFVPLDPDGLEGARRDILLDYARGDDLITLGNNYGVSKPFLLALSDDQFRRYIAALAFQKKCNRRSIEALLTIIFGPRETAGWNVFESLRRRTITIEVTSALLATGPASGTFVRTPPTRTSTVFHTGDYLLAHATEPFIRRVKPFPGSPVSSIPNNSVYVRMRGASRPVLLNVMKLVRAAGVQIEFRQRRD
jgi:hypothetical protein